MEVKAGEQARKSLSRLVNTQHVFVSEAAKQHICIVLKPGTYLTACNLGWGIFFFHKSRVSDQNGVPLLHIRIQIHHSGRKPSKLDPSLRCKHQCNFNEAQNQSPSQTQQWSRKPYPKCPALCSYNVCVCQQSKCFSTVLTKKSLSLEGMLLFIIKRPFDSRQWWTKVHGIPPTAGRPLLHFHVLVIAVHWCSQLDWLWLLALIDSLPVHQDWGAGWREEWRVLRTWRLLQEDSTVLVIVVYGYIQCSFTIVVENAATVKCETGKK